MTETRSKLLEAQYFLDRMVENQNDRNPFKYNLSAFVSAFRSVTFVMQKEFDRSEGFEEWWHDETREAIKNDDCFKLMNKSRKVTIHQKPISPRADISLEIRESITISDTFSVISSTGNSNQGNNSVEPTVGQSSTQIEYTWYFEESPHVDIITMSRNCIEKLSGLVQECEDRFTAREY